MIGTLGALLGGIFSSSTLLLVIAFLVTAYYVVTINHNYFEKRNVAYQKPLPLLGNVGPFIFRKKHISDVLIDLYQQFSKHRFFGYFDFVAPVYMLRDIQLVKQVCIKDHDYFLNHRMQLDEVQDPLFGRALFAMRDNRWRNMRSVLSPSFTGSKMRLMFDLITNYCEMALKTITREMNNGYADLEMKDLFRRFGNDIVATCAFGIENNSFADRENTFFKLGEELTNLEGLRGLKFVGFAAFPKLMRFLGIKLFTDKMTNFFRTVVMDTVSHREKHGLVRHDMIHLLMQARKQQMKFDDNNNESNGERPLMNWTDDDVTAQCTIFFFGGYDTISTLAAFMAHEIAVNPEVQRKLQQEIDDVRESLAGKPITYDVLQSMKYMDMVTTETLRLWSPAPFLDRQCTKPYVLEDYDGTKVHLNEGDGVLIPACAIMLDPEIFPEPKKFIPERHATENKSSVDTATLLSFGLGPRNCIGSRFALMEAKCCFYYLLSKFDLEACPKTQHPLQLKKSSLAPAAEKGFWIRFRMRQQ